jgi:hypothetical protein
MRRRMVVLGGLVLMAALAGCESPPTKAEILKKAEGAKTRAELEKALGQPNNLDKLGPIERWTYNAKDGTVVFTIIGDRVTITETGDRKP